MLSCRSRRIIMLYWMSGEYHVILGIMEQFNVILEVRGNYYDLLEFKGKYHCILDVRPLYVVFTLYMHCTDRQSCTQSVVCRSGVCRTQMYTLTANLRPNTLQIADSVKMVIYLIKSLLVPFFYLNYDFTFLLG